jgi:hypothetical protein
LRAPDIGYFAVQMHSSPAHPAKDLFCSRKIAAGNSEISSPRLLLAANCNASPRSNQEDRNKPLF